MADDVDYLRQQRIKEIAEQEKNSSPTRSDALTQASATSCNMPVLAQTSGMLSQLDGTLSVENTGRVLQYLAFGNLVQMT